MFSCVLLVLFSLVTPKVLALDSCAVPGIPGIPGFPGRDGRDGIKGEKGEPGLSSLMGGRMKGPEGNQGPEGPMGKRGASGDAGPKGTAGQKGGPGEPGESRVGGVPPTAAFSVARGTLDYPDKASVIRFTNVFTNLNNDYNTQTGRFRCRVPGTYYFVYHASTDTSLCVKMKLDDTILAAFCDRRSKRRQVTSGGLAVYVSQDQEVFLETTDFRGMRGHHNGYSVFSGFLLQAH